jgi:[acyl-carrier-protein] S-malonyltransferase
MKFVFLFPGQGSQTHRMGFELYRDLPECRRIFEEAGPAICRRIFEGRAEDLQATENLQPALSVVNAACLEALRARGYQAEAVAGHSLGEFTAAYAAGVFGFSHLLRLTEARGKLMAAAASANPGGMLAVTGLSEEQIRAIVDEASTAGVLCIANRNSEDQVVLSGQLAALEQAASQATRAGARKLVRLAVSGAWHSPLMSESRALFEPELQSVTFSDAQIDLYPNVTAEPTRSATTIRELLARQIDSTVLWAQTIRNLIRDHPGAQFVEVGPGRVLTGLLLSIDRRRTIHHVDSPPSLATFVRAIGERGKGFHVAE